MSQQEIKLNDYLTKSVKNKVNVKGKMIPVFKSYVSSLSIDYINNMYKEWKKTIEEDIDKKMEETLDNLVYVINELFSNFACLSVFYTKDKELYIDVLGVKENIEYILKNKLYEENKGIKEALLLLDAVLSFDVMNKTKEIERKNDLILFFMKKNNVGAKSP